jgi:hypothetical protein
MLFNLCKKILPLTLLSFIFISQSFGQEAKSIAVIGFINQGERSDDNINLTITKSLTTFLSKIPGVKVSPYTEVEKITKQDGFWEQNKLDVTAASDIGLKLKVKQIIIGDYRVNKKKETIAINVYVYDAITSELKMKRQYEGGSGRDIFDTIDNLIRSTSSALAGRNITMGRLKVDIEAAGLYRLYINAYPQKDVKRRDGFNDNVVANENVEVSIRAVNNKEENEVYREFIKVPENNTYEIKYRPAQTKRALYFPLKVLEGGLGASVGVNWRFTDSLSINALGGAVYIAETIIPTASLDLKWNFWKDTMYASAGGFCYFSKSLIISPTVMVGFEIWNIFLEAGVRYSFAAVDGGIKPLLGIGYRF